MTSRDEYLGFNWKIVTTSEYMQNVGTRTAEYVSFDRIRAMASSNLEQDPILEEKS